MPKKNQRSIAKQQGMTQYFTGLPCKNGHIANRCVNNSECVVCHNERTKQYRLSNLEVVRKRHRIYQVIYQKENPEVKRKAQSLRRARLKGVEGSFTVIEIKELMSYQNNLCPICNCDLLEKGYQIDHKIPLSRGGNNYITNIQLLCPDDNRYKNSSTDEEYRIKLGKS